MDYVNWVVENSAGIVAFITAAVALAVAVTKLTPTKTDDAIVAMVAQYAGLAESAIAHLHDSVPASSVTVVKTDGGSPAAPVVTK